MKKYGIAMTALLAGMVAQVQAQESPWLVRLRAVHLDMSNDDGTGQGLAVSNKTMPELDVSYFFDKNLATELNLGVPERHILSSRSGEIGTFRQMPATLMFQYHFTDSPLYKPYVGLGINYTRFTSVNLGAQTLDGHSWGGAMQVGIDIPLDRNWSFNMDLKKLYVKTDVGGSNPGTLKLDPLMAGVGIGYRF